MTELFFKDKAAMDKMFAIASEPGIAEEIAVDEEKFLDRNATRMFAVEEYVRD